MSIRMTDYCVGLGLGIGLGIASLSLFQTLTKTDLINPPQTIPTTEGRIVGKIAGSYDMTVTHREGVNPVYELHIATDDRRQAIELALGFAARLRWDEMEDERESEAGG